MGQKEWLKRLPMDLLMDIVGGTIFAIGLNCFASPNDIAPGGVSGIAILLNYLTKKDINRYRAIIEKLGIRK